MRQDWKQGKFWRWPAISLVVLAGGLFLVQLTQANPASEYVYPAPNAILTWGAVEATLTSAATWYAYPGPVTSTPIPRDPLNLYLSEIQLLEQALQGDLDAETRASLEARLQMLYAEATREAIDIQQLTTTPQTTRTLFGPSTVEIEGQRETGIIQYPSVPFSTSMYRITNAWQDLVNGEYVLVFVGTRASDPEQGVVIVMVDPPHLTGVYETPTRSGAISITDVAGLRLVIQSSSTGEIYYFDVPAQKFVSSLDEVVPTATTIPTRTATITPPPLYP